MRNRKINPICEKHGLAKIPKSERKDKGHRGANGWRCRGCELERSRHTQELHKAIKENRPPQIPGKATLSDEEWERRFQVHVVPDYYKFLRLASTSPLKGMS